MSIRTTVYMLEKEEQLKKIKSEIYQIGTGVVEAIREKNKKKASMLYKKCFRLTMEYFDVENEVKHLRLICS